MADTDPSNANVEGEGAPIVSGPVPRPIELAAGSNGQTQPLLPAPGHCRYLVGFMDPPMLAQQLQAGMVNIDSVAAMALQRQQVAAAATAQQLAPIALDPGDLLQIDGANQLAWIGQVMSDPAFQIFAGQQVVFAHVPIARLTTFQPFVRALHLPMPEDEDGVFQSCLPKQPSLPT